MHTKLCLQWNFKWKNEFKSFGLLDFFYLRYMQLSLAFATPITLFESRGRIRDLPSYLRTILHPHFIWLSAGPATEIMYSLIQYKSYNSKLKFFDGVQFKKYFISLPAFYLIIWLMKSPKNFEKTSISKIR